MEITDWILDPISQATGTVRKRLHEHRHKTGAENPSGDTQIAADDWVDSVFYDKFAEVDTVGAYASEERPDVIDLGDGYGVTIDPLDGSSNLLSNSVTGTIIGVYDAPLPAQGRDLVAAALILYGSYTSATIATDDSVTRHVLVDGESIDRDPVSLPEQTSIYGYAGKRNGMSNELRTSLDDIGEDHKVRYSGAMVADVTQLLTHGGVLVYPSHGASPKGDLRLQYESNPVAYIVEQADGASSDGSQSILDVSPTICINVYRRSSGRGNWSNAFRRRLRAFIEADIPSEWAWTVNRRYSVCLGGLSMSKRDVDTVRRNQPSQS